MSKRNNEQAYVDAAEIIDTAANFLGWNFGECVNMSKKYDAGKGTHSVKFSANAEMRKRLAEAVSQKNPDVSDDGNIMSVTDEDGTVLSEVRIEDGGFTVSVNDKLLRHSRFGRIVSDVWRNITE